MDFKDKKVVAYAVLGLVILGVLLWFLFFDFKVSPGVTPAGSETASPTALPVPDGTVVPDVNSTNTPPDVAKPTSVTNGPANISFNNFKINIANGKVSPQNINIYVGTPVNITFSSDKAYVLKQPENGLSWSVPAGGSFTAQFQANQPGKFIYYCEACGGPSSGPVGYLVVVSK